MAFEYGYWKVPVRAKHPIRFSIRQYLPPVMVAGTVACLAAAVFSLWTLLPVGIYLVAVLMAAFKASAPNRTTGMTTLCAAALILMHFGYGVGYFAGIWDVYFRRKFQSLTAAGTPTDSAGDSAESVR